MFLEDESTAFIRRVSVSFDTGDTQEPAVKCHETEMARGSDILTLDIGGREIAKTRRSTLTQVPESKLAKWFMGSSDHNSLPIQSDGSYFIDCKPELFLPLLDYLRTLGTIKSSSLDGPNQARLMPITPHFTNEVDEYAFRRLVDAYGLTDLLYHYKIFQAGTSPMSWSSGRTLVSHNMSA